MIILEILRNGSCEDLGKGRALLPIYDSDDIETIEEDIGATVLRLLSEGPLCLSWDLA